jgi:hypothetical protein
MSLDSQENRLPARSRPGGYLAAGALIPRIVRVVKGWVVVPGVPDRFGSDPRLERLEHERGFLPHTYLLDEGCSSPSVELNQLTRVVGIGYL